MRIAAGVLLIIAAVFNLFASLGYLGGGAASAGLSSLSDAAIESSFEADESLTAEEAAAAEEFTSSLKGAGGLLMAMGVFLLVSVGVLIAGAVFLFQSKQPKFVIAAGVIALLAEVFGMLITSFGVLNAVGIVAGVLTIIAATQFMNAPAEPAAVQAQ